MMDNIIAAIIIRVVANIITKYMFELIKEKK